MTRGYGIPLEAYELGEKETRPLRGGFPRGYETIDYWMDEWLRMYPESKKLGITRDDWMVLMFQSRDPAKVQRELDTWISTGYIDKARAQGIWKAVDWMVRQSTAQFIYGELDPRDRERRLAQEREAAGRRPAPYRAAPRAVAPRPEPLEYGPALEEMRLGFREEMPKTERWRDWFRSKYPRLIEQFEAKPEAERTKATWAEYLKKKKPEIKEQWYGLGWYGRGERPAVHAPRIQTVGF